MRGQGSLHVLTGCMFSGKTEEPLRLLRRASVGGRSVLLIRPTVDTRSPSEVAESRSGTTYECTSVGGAADIAAVGRATSSSWRSTSWSSSGAPDSPVDSYCR